MSLPARQRKRQRGTSAGPGDQLEVELHQDFIDILEERGLDFQVSMNGSWFGKKEGGRVWRSGE